VFEDFIPVALFDWRCEALERDAGARSELLVAQGVALADGLASAALQKIAPGVPAISARMRAIASIVCRPHSTAGRRIECVGPYSLDRGEAQRVDRRLRQTKRAGVPVARESLKRILAPSLSAPL